MPNAIKYNTSAETLALKKGNFWIGTGDVGKGPTSSTGFYNGITPPSGGYTIYLNKETGGPSIYTVNTEAQLTALTNSISVMTNLVPNGGNFIDGTRNPFYYDYGGTVTVVDITNNKPYNGSQSTKALQIVNGGCWMSTDGMMTVGKTYTFSFWAKKTDGTSGVVGGDKGPVWNNQNGSGEINNFSYPWNGTVLPTTIIDGNWRRYTYTFNYNVARTQLYFYGVVGTTIFTEFQITEGTAAGGPGIPTTSECLNWFASVPTDKIIFNRDYEPIVTDGLVLNLDAGFTSSYPTKNNSWYDISGNGNHATLVNGPTFTSDYGGAVVFDGIDDYAYIPATNNLSFNNSSFSYSLAFSIPNWTFTSERIVLEYGDAGFQGYYQITFYPNQTTFRTMGINGYNIWFDTTVNFTANQNYIVTLTYSLQTSSAKLYINGVLVNIATITGTSQPTPKILYIYSRGGTRIFQKGNLYNILAYNIALSSSQVSQNYNALKGRFGLS